MGQGLLEYYCVSNSFMWVEGHLDGIMGKGQPVGYLEENQVYQIISAMQFRFGTPERNREVREL